MKKHFIFIKTLANPVSTQSLFTLLAKYYNSGRGHVVFGTKTRPRRQRNQVYTDRALILLTPKIPPGGHKAIKTTNIVEGRLARDEVRDVPHCSSLMKHLI
jgi:hypothetical protein